MNGPAMLPDDPKSDTPWHRGRRLSMRPQRIMFDFLKRFVARKLGRRPVDRVAHRLYVTAVEAARTPALFTAGGVADTLDGRFDMIALHLSMVMDVLDRAPGERSGEVRELETRLMEVHFSDMDQALREMGVGDLGVGKRVKAMARAFMGRKQAYGAAFEDHDRTGHVTALEDALTRNAYRGDPPGAAAVDWLAAYCQRQRSALGEGGVDGVLAGDVAFAGVSRGDGDE